MLSLLPLASAKRRACEVLPSRADERATDEGFLLPAARGEGDAKRRMRGERSNAPPSPPHPRRPARRAGPWPAMNEATPCTHGRPIPRPRFSSHRPRFRRAGGSRPPCAAETIAHGIWCCFNSCKASSQLMSRACPCKRNHTHSKSPECLRSRCPGERLVCLTEIPGSRWWREPGYVTKHPEVIGQTKTALRQTLRTDGAINNAAHSALRSIMRNGVTTTPTLTRYGRVAQIKVPAGFGARWRADGRWIGLINP